MKNKVKILFYTELWANAGIESVIMSLFRNFDLDRIQVDIMASQNISDFYDDEIRRLGGRKIITLQGVYSSPAKRMLANRNAFEKALKEYKYDVVHLHMCNSAAMMYGRIAKQAGVLVVVYHSHNTNLSTNHRLIKTMVHTLSKYRFEKYGDVYFSCSDLASKWMFTKRSVRENKVQVINNGIDLERFAFDPVGREKCRGILGIGNKTLIGHIGRFGVAKNHPFLIDVFDDYHKVNPESVLLLIGEGDYEQIIRDKVHALGLDDSVIFYGTTKEIPQMLWAMDVFVLPSLFEGNPVVGIEAQAASVPCIFADTITRMCQLTENVSYLSLEAPYEQWSDEISRMSQLERKNTTSEMRSAGYDIKMVAKEVQAVYETVLKQKKK